MVNFEMSMIFYLYYPSSFHSLETPFKKFVHTKDSLVVFQYCNKMPITR